MYGLTLLLLLLFMGVDVVFCGGGQERGDDYVPICYRLSDFR